MRMIVALPVLVLVGLGGIAVGRQFPPRESAPAAAAPSRALADEALPAEVYVVAPAAIRETVRTVGTLLANESVELVSELSRRLVAVHVAEGTTVERGDLLFQLDDADLRAALAELEVRRRLALRTEERQRTLLEIDPKALSQQAYDQAQAAREQVDAEIAALRVTLAKTGIRAPFRARAGLRQVSEGAWITPETPLITLQDTQRVKVDFSLPERYAGSVSPGDEFRFEVAGNATAFRGTVLAIEPAIDASTRSLRVRGIADNDEGTLLPGSFASVDITVASDPSTIVVPAQAIVPSATGHAVFVVRDGRAERVEVEIGIRSRDGVQVRTGLEPGDRVATSNLLRLRPGVRVVVAEVE